jgi:hypothetical protein
MTRLVTLNAGPIRSTPGPRSPLTRITHIMPELALDHHERDALVRHLDGVRVP